MAYATRHPQHGAQADLEAGDREPFEVLLHLTANERDALLLASREWQALESIGAALDELGERDRLELEAKTEVARELPGAPVSGPVVYPAGYEGECASCQEHAELFHAQHQEDLDRLPPPLPFCRPCADFALDQLRAEQAEIDRLDAEEPLIDDETAAALLDENERRYWSEA